MVIIRIPEQKLAAASTRPNGRAWLGLAALEGPHLDRPRKRGRVRGGLPLTAFFFIAPHDHSERGHSPERTSKRKGLTSSNTLARLFPESAGRAVLVTSGIPRLFTLWSGRLDADGTEP